MASLIFFSKCNPTCYSVGFFLFFIFPFPTCIDVKFTEDGQLLLCKNPIITDWSQSRCCSTNKHILLILFVSQPSWLVICRMKYGLAYSFVFLGDWDWWQKHTKILEESHFYPDLYHIIILRQWLFCPSLIEWYVY